MNWLNTNLHKTKGPVDFLVALNAFSFFGIQYWPKAWHCLFYSFFLPSIINERCINVLTFLSSAKVCVCARAHVYGVCESFISFILIQFEKWGPKQL